MAGAVVSTKMMCWTQVAVLLHRSVAFQVRSMPGTPAHPGGVPVSGKLSDTGPPQVSVAVAVAGVDRGRRVVARVRCLPGPVDPRHSGATRRSPGIGGADLHHPTAVVG